MAAYQEETHGVATGIRFKPILIWLLWGKALKHDISIYTKDVFEKDLYGAHPGPGRSSRTLMKTNGNYTTLIRPIRGGQTELKAFKGCGGGNKNHIGSMKEFKYIIDNSDGGDKSVAVGKGHWYMHEYSLCGDSFKVIRKTVYIIYRVIRDAPKDSQSIFKRAMS
ncbi:OLC1v1031847C1 [Oldenlandia corymbosa var. corymbosa]|uniref:OLC1v1031847C1 n=1 Tax=Oldenlandia corymbosa var. corymbosa TaxID=529605 RepID=A0AAV1CKD4_OLDCO|nr:OLC1v1031847C1 [Oldenlandia corymbosa var. corymbosa]